MKAVAQLVLPGLGRGRAHLLRVEKDAHIVGPGLQRAAARQVDDLAHLHRHAHDSRRVAGLIVLAVHGQVCVRTLCNKTMLFCVVVHARVLLRAGVGGAGGYYNYAQHHGQHGYPALVGLHARDEFYPALGVVAEGERHRQAHAAARGHVEQGLGVIGLRALAQSLYRGLVAACLHVAHGQHPGEPHQRVEPVQAQRNIRQRLYYVVAAPDMPPFVCQHALALALCEPLRQVYARHGKAGHKGRIYTRGHIHTGADLARIPEPHPQAQIGHERPKQHASGDKNPHTEQHIWPGYTGARSLRHSRALNRPWHHDRARRPGILLRLYVVHHRDRPPARAHRCARQVEERERRTHRYRAEQPEKHHAPKRIRTPAGRPLDCQPRHEHHEDYNARREAHVQHSGEERIFKPIQHALTPSSCLSAPAARLSPARRAACARRTPP